MDIAQIKCAKVITYWVFLFHEFEYFFACYWPNKKNHYAFSKRYLRGWKDYGSVWFAAAPRRTLPALFLASVWFVSTCCRMFGSPQFLLQHSAASCTVASNVWRAILPPHLGRAALQVWRVDSTNQTRHTSCCIGLVWSSLLTCTQICIHFPAMVIFFFSQTCRGAAYHYIMKIQKNQRDSYKSSGLQASVAEEY